MKSREANDRSKQAKQTNKLKQTNKQNKQHIQKNKNERRETTRKMTMTIAGRNKRRIKQTIEQTTGDKEEDLRKPAGKGQD